MDRASNQFISFQIFQLLYFAPKRIKSIWNDFKFFTQVIIDLMELFSFLDLKSDLVIKNSTFDRSFRKSSIFQLLPTCVELSYGLPNPNPNMLLSPKLPYVAIDIIKPLFQSHLVKSQLLGQLFPFKLQNENFSFN